MCGILGVIEHKEKIEQDVFTNMLSCIEHRGPESGGVWISDDGTVAFGHRRLAIIDLSSGGKQPMVSDDGRFVISFNGEIYNYIEIKTELEKIAKRSFKTQSDTEVLLYAYIIWGEHCLQKLNGMFVFAVWDKKEKKLFAARDRLGEKPFKYYVDNNKFIFASEIKSILAHPSVKRQVDWQAVDEALSFRFVSSPQTGFAGIKKLPAGHFLVWHNNEVSVNRYWQPELTSQIKHSSVSEIKKTVWDLFLDSVKKRMVADVSVGAFLSGGLDSTSVVAAMREIGVKNIDTFVISMGGKSEDQKYAQMAAAYFKTNHHVIEINAIDYRKALSDMIDCYDEPFFDQSALPSMLISREIKKHVTVVLSGDGGDELFGGYDAYKAIPRMYAFSKLPLSFRKCVASAFAPVSKKASYKLEILSQDNFVENYSEYYALWKTKLPVSGQYITKHDLYLPEFMRHIDSNYAWKKMNSWFGQSRDLQNNAMIADIQGRLADGYLTKTDIATMASATELRPPFLDYRLVELAMSIPAQIKMKHNQEKWLWKEIVKNKIPEEIINRKKIGFGIPLHEIIKNELKDVVEETILPSSSRISEVFNIKTIQRLWVDHIQHKADYSNHLWSLLVAELWLRKYMRD
jgi:asparagine synthase (glutamine-hydrolysing)